MLVTGSLPEGLRCSPKSSHSCEVCFFFNSSAVIQNDSNHMVGSEQADSKTSFVGPRSAALWPLLYGVAAQILCAAAAWVGYQ